LRGGAPEGSGFRRRRILRAEGRDDDPPDDGGYTRSMRASRRAVVHLGRLAAALASLAVGALATGAIPPPRAAEADPDCAITGVARVVAVGDVHGAFDNFTAVLRMAGLVDAKLKWTGGAAHLVQTGDVLDRGPHSRKAMDLLMRLEKDARKRGGRVHALLGNHEAMNLIGDLRYVSPEEYAAFREPDSNERRERYYRLLAAEARQRAEAAGQPFDEAPFRAQFLAEAPLGFVEMRQAFSAEGVYGRWLRQRKAMVVIDGVGFLHGGVSPAVAPLGCAAINAAVRADLNEGFERTRTAPLESLSARPDGPLWYRGLAQEDEAGFTPAVDEILRSLGTRALVVGHTVAHDGRIQPRFGGRVVMIDVGMLPAYGGHRAALELGPDGMWALYPTGRERLEPARGDPTPAPAAGPSRGPGPSPRPN
jgi:hypothetical protein